MAKGKVTVVLGGQAGSEGKGKVAGYLALSGEYTAAVCNFMPNAGHTWVSDRDIEVVVRHLPQAVINDDMTLWISAGAAIDPDLFREEVDKYSVDPNRIYIHPRAVVITKEHKEREALELARIASTMKGCGAALADKAMRTATLAKDHHYLHKFVDLHWDERLWDAIYQKGQNVLIEAPQGFDLDINHGLEYPYCTSRQTITAQVIADAGLPPQAVDEVFAVIRPYPIRVGNIYGRDGEVIGYSGKYGTSKELTWQEIEERAGAPKGSIREYTTVTGRLRRVFEPDFHQIKRMCRVNGVTGLVLNFANYIDWGIFGATSVKEITPKVWAFVNKLQEETGVPVVMLGTGPRNSHMIDLRDVVLPGHP